MVPEKKIFLIVAHYKSIGVNEHLGVASLDPRGVTGRTTNNRYIINLLALGLMVPKNIFEGSLVI